VKKIIFTYPDMIIGGSTTSMLALLNVIDYSKYEVDLLLYRKRGPMLDFIPDHVNILNEAAKYSTESPYLIRLIKPFITGELFKNLYYTIKYKRKIGFNEQSSAYIRVCNSRRLEKEYDIAIGFLELWADDYVALSVKAKKKIGWIHLDCKNSFIKPQIDEKVYDRLDNIVLVSERCLDNFKEMFPKFSHKAVLLENIVDKQTILDMSNRVEATGYNIDNKKINIITVCRIEFDHKGLDRGIKAFIRLRDELGYIPFTWFIIGDGHDYKKMKQLVEQYNLKENIILLGSKINPLPFEKIMDLFFLPSRFEGKPIAVTEALMLGLPALVTNYASAHEQVEQGVTGIIVDNSEDGVYEGLYRIINDKSLISSSKKNLTNKNFSNSKMESKFISLIEGKS
jgi:glycosyltransferase involved in cell wall biosynthesis